MLPNCHENEPFDTNCKGHKTCISDDALLISCGYLLPLKTCTANNLKQDGRSERLEVLNKCITNVCVAVESVLATTSQQVLKSDLFKVNLRDDAMKKLSAMPFGY